MQRALTWFSGRDQFLNLLFLLILFGSAVSVVLEGSLLVRLLILAFFSLSLFWRARALIPVAILLFFLYVGASFYPEVIWNVPAGGFLLPLFLTLLCLLPTPLFRQGFAWFRPGSLGLVNSALVLIVSLTSVVALTLWALWADYLGIGSAMVKSATQSYPWLLVLLGIPGFALLNAFAEEAVYRGFVMDALYRRFPGRVVLVQLAQASAFASAHYLAGFPNGKVGYLMTFVYALALGYLRDRAQGMLAPFLAHFVADLTIGFLLLVLAA